jgi:hypothetical protein
MTELRVHVPNDQGEEPANNAKRAGSQGNQRRGSSNVVYTVRFSLFFFFLFFSVVYLFDKKFALSIFVKTFGLADDDLFRTKIAEDFDKLHSSNKFQTLLANVKPVVAKTEIHRSEAFNGHLDLNPSPF